MTLAQKSHVCPPVVQEIGSQQLIDAFKMGVECGIQAEEEMSEGEGFYFMEHIQIKALEIYRDLLKANEQTDPIIIGDRLKGKIKFRFHEEDED